MTVGNRIIWSVQLPCDSHEQRALPLNMHRVSHAKQIHSFIQDKSHWTLEAQKLEIEPLSNGLYVVVSKHFPFISTNVRSAALSVEL